MTDEERTAKEEAERVEEEDANIRVWRRNAILLFTGLAVLISLMGGLKWYRVQAAKPPAPVEVAQTKGPMAQPTGAVCDAGIVDAIDVTPAIIVPDDTALVIFLVCDGYPVGTTGEATLLSEGQAPIQQEFALTPIDERTSLYVTEPKIPEVGFHRVEFRINGQVVATTFTRVMGMPRQ